MIATIYSLNTEDNTCQLSISPQATIHVRFTKCHAKACWICCVGGSRLGEMHKDLIFVEKDVRGVQ